MLSTGREDDASRTLREARREETITVGELADLYNVSKSAVYYWIEHGQIPVVRVGPYRRVRVRVSVAARFFCDQTTQGRES